MAEEIIPPPQVKIPWLIGTAAAFLIFVIIGWYSKRMTWDYPDYDQLRGQQRYITLAKVRSDESKLINPVDANGKPTAEWVDQDKGLVRIPIEEAMTLEVATLKAEPLAICSEIPGAAPAPAPAAAMPAPAPAQAASTNASPAKPTPAASATAAPAKHAKEKKK
jgi:hypothetical protein